MKISLMDQIKEAIPINQSKNKIAITVTYFALFLVSIWLVYRFLPVGVDWHRGLPWFFQVGLDWKLTFRPAALELLAGHSPYLLGFYNPPWVLLPLLPLVFPSVELSSAIIFVANLFAFIYVIHKLGGRLFQVVLFFLTVFPIQNSFNCNIDGFVALGIVLPPQIGLFFLLSKPQIGLPISIFWLIEAWREGRFPLMARRFSPVTLAFLISFILFGFWPLAFGRLTDVWWNASIWPRGIPIGIAFLILSIVLRKKALSISAGPYLSPYITYHTWAFVWLGILPLIPGIREGWTMIRVIAHQLANLFIRDTPL